MLQFDLNRNIDAAARDVQAAINAAAGQLPTNLPSLPYYRKINPADSSILNIAVQSDVLPLGRLYDVADSIVAQRLSQVRRRGPGNTRRRRSAGGSRGIKSRRVLAQLRHRSGGRAYGLGQVNANQAKGGFDNGLIRWVLTDNDQLFDASQYRPLIVAYHNGGPGSAVGRRRSQGFG